MSGRLRDLIKSVRACKTAQEERDVISKESAALRQAFKEQDGTYRHRNVAKLLFMHMLGYPTHFGQMETLKLIASAGFPEKRIGYLGLMILLDERQEVLMLVTNSLKNDLNSKNQYTAGLALCALGNICSAEMARDLAPEVERLLSSGNPYLRKKAALCATRVLRKIPDMLESFAERAVALLEDRSQSVLLGGVTLVQDICAQEPGAVAAFRPHVPLLCKILRSLCMASFSPDYDVSGVADPFLQVAILRLLRVLGRGSAEASDAMSDVLAQVATNTEGARNAGNAVLYEAVQTIMAVESIGGLRVLAVNIMGRFLANRDNNIRYVALNTLARVVGVDTQAVQRHRTTIVECVKDADISIRRRALELVYALVNEGNIRTLTKELLDYLDVCDVEFKPDLANKICQLVQRYAPDKRWYIDSMMAVLVQAGPYVQAEACRALVVVVMNATQLHGYAVRACYRALVASGAGAAPALLTTAVWCIGEYGELLCSGDAKLLEGEPPVGASEDEVVAQLEAALRRPDLGVEAREYCLTALMKLGARFPASTPHIRAVIEAQTTSAALEVQSRSVEYTRLFRFDAIRPQVMEHIPPLEESAYDASLEPAEPAAGGAAAVGGDAATDLAALLGLDVGAAVAPSSSTAAAGPAAAAAPAAAPASVSALQDLLAGDLLGNGTPAAGAAAAAPVAVADPLADILGAGPSTSAPAPSFTAYQRGGITITFSLSKSGSPEDTDVLATCTNSGAEPIRDFALQAAVPKFMQLRLDPASDSVLPAGGAGSATQRLHIHNTMHGIKPLVLRLRLTYTTGDGQSVVEQAEVNQFPPGF